LKIELDANIIEVKDWKEMQEVFREYNIEAISIDINSALTIFKTEEDAKRAYEEHLNEGSET
jgi:hypothetical protein